MTLRGRGKMSDKLEFSNNLFTIKDLYLPGMVSIRTHLFDKKFQKTIKDVFKINVPNKLEFTSNKNLYLAWMSTNELLLKIKSSPSQGQGKVEKLIEHFSYDNVMQVPKLLKIVISKGVGAAVNDKKLVEHAINEITEISGQKAIATISKRIISPVTLSKYT